MTKVLLVGVGGNGSKLLVSLARLHLLLKSLGGEGFHLTALDPDEVSEANLVRQAFLPQDLGRNKAEILITRLNLAYGLTWEFRPRAVEARDLTDADLIITAVDSKRARRSVYDTVKRRWVWWVDLGNGDRYGQVVAGNGTEDWPYPPDLLPELVSGEDEDPGPSCSMLEAVLRQDLLVNDLAAVWAAEMTASIIRRGVPRYNAVFYDLDRGTTRPYRKPPSKEGALRPQGRGEVRRHGTQRNRRDHPPQP